MIFYKQSLLLCVILLFSVFSADCRRIEHRGYKKRHSNKRTHRTPSLRQLESGTSTGTASDADTDIDIDNGTGSGSGMDMGTVTGANPTSVPVLKPTNALMLIKPRQASGSSRLLGGFFLKALLSPTGGFGGVSGGGGGGVSGLSSIPYIIVNVPNNVTNINQNSLNNTADGVSTTTTPPPPTRLLYQAGPFPEPTHIYQRRGSNSVEQPHNFILSPGNQLFPVYLPPEVENLVQDSIIRSGVDQRRRIQANQNTNNNRISQNPFSAFANNLMRVQYG